MELLLHINLDLRWIKLFYDTNHCNVEHNNEQCVLQSIDTSDCENLPPLLPALLSDKRLKSQHDKV